ncbi:hypothetical protein RRG08_029267 [Elysia crispata]|uniref:Uncharacterized protein n=1 Tax=Elysia crispata TaxID=231223 RepID=A0AAE1E096_9GAST|nr:hypothetical protein RRG08_029267 [Elysia crispata]
MGQTLQEIEAMLFTSGEDSPHSTSEFCLDHLMLWDSVPSTLPSRLLYKFPAQRLGASVVPSECTHSNDVAVSPCVKQGRLPLYTARKEAILPPGKADIVLSAINQVLMSGSPNAIVGVRDIVLSTKHNIGLDGWLSLSLCRKCSQAAAVFGHLARDQWRPVQTDPSRCQLETEAQLDRGYQPLTSAR